MSKITSWDNDGDIEISFPEEKFKSYLIIVKASSIDELSFAQKRSCFVTMIADFKTGTVSLDELSEMAGTIWWSLPEMDKAKTDLASALYACSELNYYVRQIDEKNDNGFISFMKDVMEYYMKNKSLILEKH